MARPRKPEAERREAYINPRLTAAEREEIERNAALLGLSPAEFMRRRSLGYSLPTSLAVQRQTAAQATALMRLGINLNQIAKHMNAGRGAPPDLAELIGRINAELDRVYDAGADHGRAVV